eukprot:Sspe_Gene.18290::Locus_6560_Transcript_1_1_Confidence_1.000_Length_980::g.18290::m.18290
MKGQAHCFTPRAESDNGSAVSSTVLLDSWESSSEQDIGCDDHPPGPPELDFTGASPPKTEPESTPRFIPKAPLGSGSLFTAHPPLEAKNAFAKDSAFPRQRRLLAPILQKSKSPPAPSIVTGTPQSARQDGSSSLKGTSCQELDMAPNRRPPDLTLDTLRHKDRKLAPIGETPRCDAPLVRRPASSPRPPPPLMAIVTEHTVTCTPRPPPPTASSSTIIRRKRMEQLAC